VIVVSQHCVLVLEDGVKLELYGGRSASPECEYLSPPVLNGVTVCMILCTVWTFHEVLHVSY
jgi:hypothetical protein